MRDKLIELIQSAVIGCPRYWAGLIADSLIAHGVTIETGGDLLPRESVINGVLMQMQASSSPVCMEEFLRNLDGVTLAEDNNVLGKWIPVEEDLPETILCTAGTAYSNAVNALTSGRKVITAIWDGEDFIGDAAFWDAEDEVITHWTPVLLPLPEAPKEGE